MEIKDIENILDMNYSFYCDYKGAYKFILFKRLPGERLEKLPPIWIYQNEKNIYTVEHQEILYKNLSVTSFFSKNRNYIIS